MTKVEETLQIDEHDATLLLTPGFLLRISREPSHGDEEADVTLADQRQQRPHAIDTCLVSPSLDLNLDSRPLDAQGIRVGKRTAVKLWLGSFPLMLRKVVSLLAEYPTSEMTPSTTTSSPM